METLQTKLFEFTKYGGILEDIGSRNKKGLPVSTRMIIKKSTLLNWIDIIEGGEKEYTKK